MDAAIPVNDGETLVALRGLLSKLLEQGAIDVLLVPMRTPGGAVTPALVSDPLLLASSDPLAPVMPSNAATLVGKLSIRQPRARVGALLRACELRALVELMKLQQAAADDLVLMSIDCAGTYDISEFHKRTSSDDAALWPQLFHRATNEPETTDPDLRLACRMCEQPVHDQADIVIRLFGSELETEIDVSISDELRIDLDLNSRGPSDKRQAILDDLVAARKKVRDAEFTAMQERLETKENIIAVFDACIRCHNCMTVCPICYCKTCVFKSAVFDHEPMRYVGWANHKGALRLPADTSLFHLTRLIHMAVSCVGCGMCTQACPADLPVGTVFRTIGARLQETFDYLPGRSSDELLPLVTFKENEWTAMGEE